MPGSTDRRWRDAWHPQDPGGELAAAWREPSGRQQSKTFKSKREAAAFLAQMNTAKGTGAYVSPHAGRTLFGNHAREWMVTWNVDGSPNSARGSRRPPSSRVDASCL